MDIAIRVCSNNIKLFPIWQEIGSNNLDMLRRLAQKAQLGWIFRETGEPYSFDRITHDTQPGASELFDRADVALHVYERHRKQRPILFQTSNHAFLTLGCEHEALRADLAKVCYCSFDLFFCDQFQLFACLRVIGFRNDVNDVEDVDSAYSR